MGGCASRHAELAGKDSHPVTQHGTTHNHDHDDDDVATANDVMPHTADQSSPSRTSASAPYSKPGGPGLLRPYGGRYSRVSRNSNEQSLKDDRSTLGMLPAEPKDPAAGNGPRSQLKPVTVASRFGFKTQSNNAKKSEPNMNVISNSKDSLTSSNKTSVQRHSSPVLGTARVAVAGVPKKTVGAFEPPSTMGSWRMIDDCSSVYSSRSTEKVLGDSKSVTPTADDVKNCNMETQSAPIADVESLETTSGGSCSAEAPKAHTQKSTSSTGKAQGKGIGSRLPSKLRATFGKKPHAVSSSGTNGGSTTQDKWVKASPAGGDTVSPKAVPKSSGGGPGGFLRRGLMRKQKTVEESPKSSPVTTKSDAKKTVAVSAKSEPSVSVSKGGVLIVRRTITSADDNDAVFVKEDVVNKVHAAVSASEKAPIAMIDSVETTSVGSLHSDDLMLDTEFTFDEYDDSQHSVASLDHVRKHSGPRQRPRSRSGSRSRSRDRLESAGEASKSPAKGSAAVGGSAAVTETAGEKKPASLVRRHTEGSTAAPHRQDSFSKRKSGTEPFQELASLLEENNVVQTRASRYQRAARPSSFPGPGLTHHQGAPSAGAAALAEDGTCSERVTPTGAGPRALRPPRQPSHSGSIGDDDQLTMDAYTYRHTQQDINALKTMLLKLKRIIQEDEFSQSWKNGFKFGGSTPNSPFGTKDDAKFSFANAALLECEEEGRPSTQLVQENCELKQQLATLQSQLDEQEKTVKLLQTQMTKYECGYSDPQGRVYSNASTQTDKPSLAPSKSGRGSSASSRNGSQRAPLSALPQQQQPRPQQKPQQPQQQQQQQQQQRSLTRPSSRSISASSSLTCAASVQKPTLLYSGKPTPASNAGVANRYRTELRSQSRQGSDVYEDDEVFMDMELFEDSDSDLEDILCEISQTDCPGKENEVDEELSPTSPGSLSWDERDIGGQSFSRTPRQTTAIDNTDTLHQGRASEVEACVDRHARTSSIPSCGQSSGADFCHDDELQHQSASVTVDTERVERSATPTASMPRSPATSQSNDSGCPHDDLDSLDSGAHTLDCAGHKDATSSAVPPVDPSPEEIKSQSGIVRNGSSGKSLQDVKDATSMKKAPGVTTEMRGSKTQPKSALRPPQTSSGTVKETHSSSTGGSTGKPETVPQSTTPSAGENPATRTPAKVAVSTMDTAKQTTATTEPDTKSRSNKAPAQPVKPTSRIPSFGLQKITKTKLPLKSFLGLSKNKK